MKKIKIYPLFISKRFPANHPRHWQQTYFVEKVCKALNIETAEDCSGELSESAYPAKIHACSINYELWEKRIDEVNAGRAVLSLRVWKGVPLHSSQMEIALLDKDSGIGVQKLKFQDHILCPVIGRTSLEITDIAPNEGLSDKDFCSWLARYDLRYPLAVIHFTKFRY
jgi:hypothetical protein